MQKGNPIPIDLNIFREIIDSDTSSQIKLVKEANLPKLHSSKDFPFVYILLKKLYVKKNGLFLLQPKLSELIHPNEF